MPKTPSIPPTEPELPAYKTNASELAKREGMRQRGLVGGVLLAHAVAYTASDAVKILDIALRPAITGVGAGTALRYALESSVLRKVQELV